ncbi:MAG: hypothetical protein N2561_03785 [Bacteroidetes bacterium]|nr:hypothetical protein [Rhodothermia bacterium]MCX7906642.1 hypothetical protein [Bacteroidota bacterium]MDW8285052.1 hypothetical protein [Bacteroidota bacterium]
MKQVAGLVLWMGLCLHAAVGQPSWGWRLWGEAAAVLGGALDRLWVHPAGLPATSSAGLSWERRFALGELESLSAGFVGRLRSWRLGLGLSGFGFSLYRELRARLAASRALDPSLGLGVYWEAATRSVARYGRSGMLAIGGGLDWGSGPWRAAVALRPILTTAWSNREREPRRLLLAAAYAKADLELALGWEAAPTATPSPIGAFAWRPRPELLLGLGFRPEPPEWAAGAQLRRGRLRVGWAVSRHLDLGWSPLLELCWER